MNNVIHMGTWNANRDEQAVLAAMLLSKDAIADAVEVLTAGNFAERVHVLIWLAIVGQYWDGEPSDVVHIAARLHRLGYGDDATPAYLTRLVSEYGTLGDFTTDFGKRLWRMRGRPA